MSIIYCHSHNRHYDSDYQENCPVCDEVDVNTEELNAEIIKRNIEKGSQRRNLKLI